MLDRGQFIECVIRPALETIGLYSKAAEELLLGTALQESRLTYLKQLGDGPALGVFQMEPATHDDIWNNYLTYRVGMTEKVIALGAITRPMSMMGNFWYAAAMCRIHYLRVPEALPEAGDIEAQATYWKRYYNTPLGKGTEEEYIRNWGEE